ncbi:MAG: hypothetical protein ACI9KN_001424 [Gammaproteobacteria bacterium]|jgi:hypothetical protein
MSFLNKRLSGGDIIQSVGETLENLVTSDEERLENQLEISKAEREFDYLTSKLVADQNMAQTLTNITEAKTGNILWPIGDLQLVG